MNHNLEVRLRAFEGRRVSVALADGSRVDDCQLISAGREGARTVWVFSNGADVFVALADVIDVWEVAGRPLSWAA